MSEDPSPALRLRAALYQPIEDLWLEDESRSRISRAIRRRSRALRAAVGNRLFERGVDTRGRQVELDHFHPDRVQYEPSDWFSLRRALSTCEIEPADVFIDFGSGKGRAVFQAAQYPFPRVIGVEISQKLNEVARENIESNRHRLACQSIDLVTADAADFEVPDEMTTAYFYHPFSGDTFRKTIDKIVESIDRRPREVKLIYLCPKMGDYILKTGRFKLLRTSKSGRLVRRISVYVTNGPD